MKKVILALAFCLFIATSAAAQPGPPRDGRDREPPSPQQRAQRMAKELSLDENQTASLLEVLTAADAEREAMRQQHEAQIREDMCAHMNAVTGQIKSLLNEQQSAKFDELMAQRKARLEGRHGHHRKGRMPPMDCEDPGA